MFSCNLPPAPLAKWPGSFTCYCGNTGVERMDTEIRVSTESWPWRRKFSRRSCRDSNPWPFDHESGALTTEPSPPPQWDHCCCCWFKQHLFHMSQYINNRTVGPRSKQKLVIIYKYGPNAVPDRRHFLHTQSLISFIYLLFFIYLFFVLFCLVLFMLLFNTRSFHFT